MKVPSRVMKNDCEVGGCEGRDAKVRMGRGLSTLGAARTGGGHAAAHPTSRSRVWWRSPPRTWSPRNTPIRRIKPLADRVLQELSPTFSRMYAKGGRPSVPPEHLLKASLLIALYSVRSERQFCERLAYDMLFRWFLDLNIRGGSFDQSTFAKNRTRLLAHEVTGRFFGAMVSEARRQRLLSEEHFSVDGTLFGGVGLPQERPAEGRGEGPANGARRATSKCSTCAQSLSFSRFTQLYGRQRSDCQSGSCQPCEGTDGKACRYPEGLVDGAARADGEGRV